MACNGHAIGASVTSATLCDAIVASPDVTFTTPFGRLGITPEGCSSIHFEKSFGADFAHEMLHENRVLKAEDGVKIGFVDEVVQDSNALLSRAREIASKKIGKPRKIHGTELEEYLQVNYKESHDLAKAFMSEKFLQAQVDFLTSKGKNDVARMFRVMLLLRPIWGRFVKDLM